MGPGTLWSQATGNLAWSEVGAIAQPRLSIPVFFLGGGAEADRLAACWLLGLGKRISVIFL